MFIELIDVLRCPTAHEESWLIVAAGQMEARHIVSGTLGCPVCAAEYSIDQGVVDLRGHRGPIARDSLRPVNPSALPPASPDSALRLAAMLGLGDAQGFAVLLGEWGRYAASLTTIVDVPLLLVDPPSDVKASPGISIVRSEGVVPLGREASRATAIDAGDSIERVASAVRVTRPLGRIVAPLAAPLPPGVRELVRDDVLVVGEVEPPAAPLVKLHVRRS